MPSLEVVLSQFPNASYLAEKSRIMRLSEGEDRMILAGFVLHVAYSLVTIPACHRRTDRQSNGRTDGMALDRFISYQCSRIRILRFFQISKKT